MRRPLIFGLGLVAMVVGLVWLGQGLNLIPGSFMTGDPTWAIIGAITLVAGLMIAIFGYGRGSMRDPNGPPGQS